MLIFQPQECRFCIGRPLQSLFQMNNYIPNEMRDKNYMQSATLNHNLYYKYSSSQNYFYSKDINEILGNTRNKMTIQFNDQQCLDDEDECLKRMYHIEEYDEKLQLLSEFYKFHKDLPRWIIHKGSLEILNYFYDKKRKLEYYKIQRMIDNENQNNPDQPPKGIVGDRPIESYTSPVSEPSESNNMISNVDNILNEINSQIIQSSQFSVQQRKDKKQQYGKLETEQGSISSKQVYIPPLQLSSSNQRDTSEIQQMISLLGIQPNSSFSKIELNTNLFIDTQLTQNIKKELRLIEAPRKIQKSDQFKPKITIKQIQQPVETNILTPSSNQPVVTTPFHAVAPGPQSFTPSDLKTVQLFTSPKAQNQKKVTEGKKKLMQKKPLKLDEAAFQGYSKFQEVKMPLSARCQPVSQKILDYLSGRIKVNNIQSSQTTSREKISKRESSKESLDVLSSQNFIKKQSVQTQKKVQTPKNSAVDLALKNRQQKDNQREAFNVQSTKTVFKLIQPQQSLKQTHKKTFNQMLMPTEMKKLEMKVLKDLKDFQHQRSTQNSQSKLFSFDQKSLNQILSTFQKRQLLPQNMQQRICDSYSQTDSQTNQPQISQTPREAISKSKVLYHQPNRSGSQNKINSCRGPQSTKVKMDKLDLRKLKSFDKLTQFFQQISLFPITQVQSARNQSRQSTKQIKTERQPSDKKFGLVTPVQSTLTSRHNSLYPLNKPLEGRLRSINNLMQWQIKAIKAASKEYNLQQVTQRK